MAKNAPPMCKTCATIFSIEHIVSKYHQYANELPLFINIHYNLGVSLGPRSDYNKQIII